MKRLERIDAEIKKLKVPPRCEAITLEKIKSHDRQLFLINNRLKPYKRNPPPVFQTAKNMFISQAPTLEDQIFVA